MHIPRGRICFSISAVSYTHLDVYKRQDHGLAISGNTQILIAVGVVRKRLELAIGIGDKSDLLVGRARRVISIVPVSYTHLDVYKRQVPISYERHPRLSKSEYFR